MPPLMDVARLGRHRPVVSPGPALRRAHGRDDGIEGVPAVIPQQRLAPHPAHGDPPGEARENRAPDRPPRRGETPHPCLLVELVRQAQPPQRRRLTCLHPPPPRARPALLLFVA